MKTASYQPISICQPNGRIVRYNAAASAGRRALGVVFILLGGFLGVENAAVALAMVAQSEPVELHREGTRITITNAGRPFTANYFGPAEAALFHAPPQGLWERSASGTGELDKSALLRTGHP